jgi:hypothetical protein
VKPTWITVHSEEGKDHHDSFDFPEIDADMESRGVHYDYLGEMSGDKPFVFRQWPLDKVGAATRGWNGSTGGERTANFTFAGDGRVEVPDDSLLAEMAKYIRETMKAYGIPIDHVKMHKDMAGAQTDCPGTVFAEQAWPKLLALIQS